MSFLFKSAKKSGPGPSAANALPPATRNLRSSDGEGPTAQHIPTLHNPGAIGAKPTSPTPGQLATSNLGAIVEKKETGPISRPPEDRVAALRDAGQGSGGSSSPEQKSLRDGSRDNSREAVRVAISLMHIPLRVHEGKTHMANSEVRRLTEIPCKRDRRAAKAPPTRGRNVD